MHKAVGYVLFLVIGLAVGVSVGTIVLISQTPNREEQVKVTIQEISCTFSEHTVLEINLENNVPERTLKGNVTVLQDEEYWTSEVKWYFTGYGVAYITCDSLNETQNFRIKYIESNPKATYLDRIIEWYEVDKSYVSQAGGLITFMTVTFSGTSGASNNTIVLYLLNPGTSEVILTEAKVTGYGVDKIIDFNDVTIYEEASEQVTLVNVGWTSGKAYNIELYSSEGNKYTYTTTAS